MNTPVDCDDGDPCTEDMCDPVTGECLHGAIGCDDGDPCTEDRCDPIAGCVHEPVDCDDGDPCTVDECVAGDCVHEPVDCDDGNPCTVDECAAGDCVNTSVDCDDGDPCTVDICDEVSAQCMHAPLVDVSISRLRLPPHIAPGRMFNVAVVVRNHGCWDTQVRVTLTSDGTPLGTASRWVKAGHQNRVRFRLEVPADGDPDEWCVTATVTAVGDVSPGDDEATGCVPVR